MHPIRFLKNWALPVAMACGALAYFAYVALPGHERYNAMAAATIAWVQPALIFMMLFVSFCKIRVHDFSLKRWHLWLLLLQVGSFVSLAALAVSVGGYSGKIVVESAMLCMICPTATAAAVITSKLGGDQASLVSYTMLINLAVAVCAPVVLPHVYLHAGLTFWPALWAILMKVFPLLIGPLLLATAVRHYCRGLHAAIMRHTDVAFYLWTVALALAITVTVKALMHTTASAGCLAGIAVVSLLACALQFAAGRYAGGRYGERVSGGQACGQKNTVLIIWMGYTFLDPVTAIAGGFYSVWHNVFNSWQLYRRRRLGDKA